jgi:AcrR family transcriptional regulator
MTGRKNGRQEAAAEVRGPHSERSAAMRKRVIDAAIDCLGKLGYGATTLQVVNKAADVSRGAMLHHFPSKVDLMVAVAEYAAERQGRYVRRRLADTRPGMERYEAITIATWDSMMRPPAIAFLEVIAGARGDPDLAAKLTPVLQDYDDRQRQAVWEQAQSAGIIDRASIEAMCHLHIAAMRGLALGLPFSRSSTREQASVGLLQRYKRKLTSDLLNGRKS